MTLSRSAEELEILLRARYSVIYVVTWEEGRVEDALAQIARRREKRVMLWSVARGLQPYSALPDGSRRVDTRTTDPSAALDAVLETMENAIYVFRDLHPFWGDPGVVRRVRELAVALKNSYKTLVIVGPTLQLPLELQKEVVVVEFDLPSRQELGELLDRTVQEVSESTGNPIAVTDEARRRILDAAGGLTLGEAENVLARTLVVSGGLSEADLSIILSEKEQAIRKSGLLEYYHPDAKIRDIGGLDYLKEWLVKRSAAFQDDARAFGLPAPRGILLIGVQGCGKSLLAKAVASQWELPLLRLDVGRLFGSLVGLSEENMRNAIRVAESVAPAILWVDEIEKSLAGGQGGGGADSGTTARVLATFLTWMQEKTAPVFVVATANSIEHLPPELLRRGRLDETFFVDLPNPGERAAIFEIHLAKRNRPPELFDLERLAAASEGFSGAEIEQCVIDALFEAYSRGAELNTDFVDEACRRSIPLSRTMREPIERLRSWAKGRAQDASRPGEGDAQDASHPALAAQTPGD